MLATYLTKIQKFENHFSLHSAFTTLSGA